MFRKIFKLTVFVSLLSAGFCFSAPKSVAEKGNIRAFDGKVVRRSSSPKRRQLKESEIAKILCSRSIIIPDNGDMQATDDLKTIALGTQVYDISGQGYSRLALKSSLEHLWDVYDGDDFTEEEIKSLDGDMQSENSKFKVHSVSLDREGTMAAVIATLVMRSEGEPDFTKTTLFELPRHIAEFKQDCFSNEIAGRDILPNDQVMSYDPKSGGQGYHNIVINNPGQEPAIQSPLWDTESVEIKGAKKVLGCGHDLFWSVKNVDGSDYLALSRIINDQEEGSEDSASEGDLEEDYEEESEWYKSIGSSLLNGSLVSSSTNLDCTKLVALIENAEGDRILKVLAKSDSGNGVEVIKEVKQEDICGPQSKLSKVKLSANGKVLAACVEGLNNGVVRVDLVSGKTAICPEFCLVKDVFPNEDGSKALVHLPGANSSLIKEIVLAR